MSSFCRPKRLFSDESGSRESSGRKIEHSCQALKKKKDATISSDPHLTPNKQLSTQAFMTGSDPNTIKSRYVTICTAEPTVRQAAAAETEQEILGGIHGCASIYCPIFLTIFWGMMTILTFTLSIVSMIPGHSETFQFDKNVSMIIYAHIFLSLFLTYKYARTISS